MDKKCSKCKIIKNISMFYRNKYRTDGKQSDCKICHNETTMKWRKANPDKYSKYNCSPKRNKKQKTKSKLRSRRHRHDISDRYMRDVLSMNSDLEHEDITDEMIELARINLKIKRNLKLTKKLKPFE
jgi:hypothetical protein|tara:strand:- start:49 stop:429 length:381 start_codon:yes stop_codon:yes gene_type:complete